jgi:hypothetical protein
MSDPKNSVIGMIGIPTTAAILIGWAPLGFRSLADWFCEG